MGRVVGIKFRFRRRLTGLLAVACLLVVWPLGRTALALDPGKAFTQLNRDTWTTQQGLPDPTVNAIAQTKDGYLWLASQAGLVRFDGVRFTVFNSDNTKELKTKNVAGLFVAKDGSLWMSVPGTGFVKYQDGKFTTYSSKDGPIDDGGTLTVYEDKEGSVWFSGWSKLAKRKTHYLYKERRPGR